MYIMVLFDRFIYFVSNKSVYFASHDFCLSSHPHPQPTYAYPCYHQVLYFVSLVPHLVGFQAKLKDKPSPPGDMINPNLQHCSLSG